MGWNEFYHFLNPSWWCLSAKYDQRVDKLLTMLINDASSVDIIDQDNYNIVLLYKNKRYRVWIANYPYTACSHLTVYQDNNVILDLRDKRPHRSTIYNFIKTFYKKSLIENKKTKQECQDDEVVNALLNDIPIVVNCDKM